MTRLAGVDIGNDSLKAVFDDSVTYYVPNVIAEIDEERNVYALEQNTLEGLHVKVVSGGLKNGKGIYAVGQLASKYPESRELTLDIDKATSDQSLALLLTVIALDAAEHLPTDNDVIKANYLLSTGLPLHEVKRKLRLAFRERLLKNQHEVTFMQTPNIAGKRVVITFDEVLVGSEGLAAMIDLAYNEDGSAKNEEIIHSHILINDIGGLSTDAAVIEPTGTVDNVNSQGLKEGVSPYLDNIMRRVEEEWGYRFRSRRALVDVLTQSQDRYKIRVHGSQQSIKNIVDTELRKLAQREYRHIQDIWIQVPELYASYQIGGGSVLLRDYMETLNEAQDKLPLRFVDAETSIWMIARAYYKLAKMQQVEAV